MKMTITADIIHIDAAGIASVRADVKSDTPEMFRVVQYEAILRAMRDTDDDAYALAIVNIEGKDLEDNEDNEDDFWKNFEKFFEEDY